MTSWKIVFLHIKITITYFSIGARKLAQNKLKNDRKKETKNGQTDKVMH